MPFPNAKAVRCRLHHDRRDTLCIFGKHCATPMTAVGHQPEELALSITSLLYPEQPT
jgi:hypothetical protein